MILLHGHWLPPVQSSERGRFILWGETSDGKLTKPRGRPSWPVHAFAAAPAQLHKALEVNTSLQECNEVLTTLILPALKNLPWPSPRLAHEWDTFEGVVPTGLKRFKLHGLALLPVDALHILNRLPGPDTLPPDLALGDDLIYWVTAARLGLEILTAERYIPAIDHVDTQLFQARWRPVFDRPDDTARLSHLVRAMPPSARAGLPAELAGDMDPPPAYYLLEDFLTTVIDLTVREWVGGTWKRQPGDSPAAAWLNALMAPDPAITGPYFVLRSLHRAHQTWVRRLHAAGDAHFRICLRLGVPEKPDEPWPLEFLLQATDDPSLLVEAGAVWKSRGRTFNYVDRRFENPQERLLTALGYAAGIFPPLEASLRQRRPTAAYLDTQEAYTFLREAVPLLEQSGFGLLVPPWWKRRGARLGTRLRLKADPSPPSASTGLLSLENLVRYDWEIVLGDQTLSREEFEELVRLKMPLVEIRGQWVALNPEEIEAAIRFWEERQGESRMSVLDALVWALAGEGEVDGLLVEAVEVSGWLGELLENLKRDETLEDLQQPAGLNGELRPYQARGFSWIAFMRRWGLGACLADDMGLGKTIQTLAFFLFERAENTRTQPALVICPTSVAGNWQREIERFAPILRVRLHHGAGRATGDAFVEQAGKYDVIVTSYGLARRDADFLVETPWSTLVLDEAQNIKNPSAKQTQAIRRIPASFRLALTGTPVENRLSDLWSLMHFLNPGYLGSQKSFRRAYTLPIERHHNPDAARTLRQLVGTVHPAPPQNRRDHYPRPARENGDESLL